MSYRSRIESDLQRWQSAGWITGDGMRSIRADLDARRSPYGLPHVLAVLGAVLLCFAAMTFVASNWQTLSKLVRLAILAAGLWGSFAAALAFFRRGQDAFGHAAVLAGTGVFGASIMLIAQMYHIDGHPPDAVLVWWLGTTLTGLALRSMPSLVLATLLLALWSAWAAGLDLAVHWAFLPAWLTLTVLSLAVTRAKPLFHLLAISLAGWVFLLAVFWSGPAGFLRGPQSAPFLIPLLAGLGLAAATGLAQPWIDRIVVVGKPATAYLLATSYAAAWSIQFVQRHHAGLPLGVWFVLSLAALVALIVLALRSDNRPVLWLSYAAFSIELVSIYFKTLGTLLNTSLFFLSAGLLVIGLSWVAWKLHRNIPAASATPGTPLQPGGSS